jgi:hypothetical protein
MPQGKIIVSMSVLKDILQLPEDMEILRASSSDFQRRGDVLELIVSRPLDPEEDEDSTRTPELRPIYESKTDRDHKSWYHLKEVQRA